jgi:hypothetical protein
MSPAATQSPPGFPTNPQASVHGCRDDISLWQANPVGQSVSLAQSNFVQ